MKKIFISLGALVLAFSPAVASAQIIGGATPNFSYANSWIVQVMAWSQQAVTFLMVIATLYFIWSVIRFIMDKGDDAKATSAKKKAMINGIIGLFVIVGIWGIIKIISSTLGVSGGSIDPSQVPCPPGMTYNAAIHACN